MSDLPRAAATHKEFLSVRGERAHHQEQAGVVALPASMAATAKEPVEAAFGEVVRLIRAARQRAAQVVNTEVIDLYWCIGQYLHHKIEADGSAKGTVVELAAYIAQREPGKRGFSSQNLWRMRQFFEAYPTETKRSPLVRALPWPAHLHILTRANRAVLNPPKLSTALREPQADRHFNDADLLEFLALPGWHQRLTCIAGSSGHRGRTQSHGAAI